MSASRSHNLRPWLIGAATAAVYFGGAAFGLSLATVDDQVSPVWPPTGIALAAVLLFGWRIWPAIAAGAFAINAWTGPLPTALAIACGNTLEALVGGFLIRRFVGFVPALERPRDVLGLVICGGVLATTVSATIGVTSLCASGQTPWSRFDTLWLTWWLGDGMGALVVAPALLTTAAAVQAREAPRRTLESLTFLGTVAVISVFLLHGWTAYARQLEYLLFPLFVWSALRLSQTATAVGIMVVSGVAILAVQSGSDAFSAMTTNERLLLMQTFVGVLALGSLALGAVEAERTRNARARRESEERLQAIFNQGISGISQVGLGERFLLVSPRFCELVGRSAEELLGLHLREIIHPDDRPAHEGLFRRCIHEGAGYVHEARYVRPDGTSIWVQSSVSAVRSGDGHPESVVLVSQDIDEQKRLDMQRAAILASEQAARMEAERLARMKDEFVATLSHELRTPLNGVLGWAHLLKRDGADPETRAQGVEAIERCARALARLIDDLLDMTRIAAGKMRLSVEPVDLAAAIDAAIGMIAPSAAAKQIRIEKAFEPLHGVVQGDSARLQQVVSNLLSNAVKFTPTGGVVTVSLQRRDGRARVVVADTGQGIDAEFLPHVFDRFRQADSSTTRRFSGLGLGLAIVKHIVQLHGGTVWAESEGPGQGASFGFEVPATQASKPRGPRGSDAGENGLPWGALRGVRILVVDDDSDSSEILRRALGDFGAEILLASSADEAMARLEQKPELLISDIGMPDKDGYALIRTVRKLPDARLRHIPAVAMTAFARPEDRERALTAGYDRHVAKPVEVSVLLSAVSELLTARR